MNPLLFKSSSGRLPASDTRNEAGGKAFALGPQLTLAQYAATGCLNGTFYASAETQLDTVLKMAAACDAEFVAKTAVFSRQRGFMKDVPALLAAHLAQRDPVLLRKVFDRVIDDGKMLRNFVQIIRSGVTGRKSLGTAPKRLVQRWLAARTDDQLLRASVGQQPSLADVVKMVHPKPNTTQRQALYGWLCSRKVEAALLPPLVQAFEAFKASRDAPALPDVPFIMDLLTKDEDRALWNIAVAPLGIGRPYLLPPDVPKDRVDAMRKAFWATINDPEFLAEQAKINLGADTPRTGEQIAALIGQAYKAPKDVVDRINRLQGEK